MFLAVSIVIGLWLLLDLSLIACRLWASSRADDLRLPADDTGAVYLALHARFHRIDLPECSVGLSE